MKLAKVSCNKSNWRFQNISKETQRPQTRFDLCSLVPGASHRLLFGQPKKKNSNWPSIDCGLEFKLVWGVTLTKVTHMPPSIAIENSYFSVISQLGFGGIRRVLCKSELVEPKFNLHFVICQRGVRMCCWRSARPFFTECVFYSFLIAFVSWHFWLWNFTISRNLSLLAFLMDNSSVQFGFRFLGA